MPNIVYWNSTLRVLVRCFSWVCRTSNCEKVAKQKSPKKVTRKQCVLQIDKWKTKVSKPYNPVNTWSDGGNLLLPKPIHTQFSPFFYFLRIAESEYSRCSENRCENRVLCVYMWVGTKKIKKNKKELCIRRDKLMCTRKFRFLPFFILALFSLCFLAKGKTSNKIAPDFEFFWERGHFLEGEKAREKATKKVRLGFFWWALENFRGSSHSHTHVW